MVGLEAALTGRSGLATAGPNLLKVWVHPPGVLGGTRQPGIVDGATGQFIARESFPGDLIEIQGFGGAGVTLSWGAAIRVLNLVIERYHWMIPNVTRQYWLN